MTDMSPRLHIATGQLVAIKILNLDTSMEEVADVQREINLLAQIKASQAVNVTRYHGCQIVGTRLWIVMDYCSGGSVRTLMKASGRIEERYIAVIAHEILLAMRYIHANGIIHRDIKAANILLTSEGHVQLCDFGVAAQMKTNQLKRSTFVGTPYWMAPEVITDGAAYNQKADVWSFGVTLYEMAMGNPPYSDQEPMRAIFLIPRSKPARLQGNEFTPMMREFVATCLEEQPDERPSSDELFRHKWIKGATKYPISMLKDLIVRYENWARTAGNVRDSLVQDGHDSDNSDETDEDLLDDGRSENGTATHRASHRNGLHGDGDAVDDGWQFDTVKTLAGRQRSIGTQQRSISSSVLEETSSHDTDATVKQNFSVREPSVLPPIDTRVVRGDYGASAGLSAPAASHPLRQLFEEEDSKADYQEILAQNTPSIEIPPISGQGGGGGARSLKIDVPHIQGSLEQSEMSERSSENLLASSEQQPVQIQLEVSTPMLNEFNISSGAGPSGPRSRAASVVRQTPVQAKRSVTPDEVGPPRTPSVEPSASNTSSSSVPPRNAAAAAATAAAAARQRAMSTAQQRPLGPLNSSSAASSPYPRKAGSPPRWSGAGMAADSSSSGLVLRHPHMIGTRGRSNSDRTDVRVQQLTRNNTSYGEASVETGVSDSDRESSSDGRSAAETPQLRQQLPRRTPRGSDNTPQPPLFLPPSPTRNSGRSDATGMRGPRTLIRQSSVDDVYDELDEEEGGFGYDASQDDSLRSTGELDPLVDLDLSVLRQSTAGNAIDCPDVLMAEVERVLDNLDTTLLCMSDGFRSIKQQIHDTQG